MNVLEKGATVLAVFGILLAAHGYYIEDIVTMGIAFLFFLVAVVLIQINEVREKKWKRKKLTKK